jgi:PAS domain S-box-containing protein
MKKRELFDLSLVLVFSIFFSLFSISINFTDRFNNFFYTYTKLPIAEFLLNIIFLWLVGLLWITYRNWRRAIKRQKELEDIIGSISPDALIVVNRKRNIIMCNATIKRMFGYEVNEVINKKTDFLYYDRRHEPSQKHEIYDMLERIGFHIGLAKGKKKNGDTIPLEIVTTKLSGSEGVVLLLREISERVEADKEINATKDHLNNIIESSLDSIVLTDNKGYVTRTNKSFLELTGYTEENQVIGKHMAEFSPMEAGTYDSITGESAYIDKDLLDSIVMVMSNFTKEGKISNLEFYLIRTDKKVIPVEENIVNLYNKEGERTATAGIIRDISERKRSEREIKETKELLESLIENSTDGILTTDAMGYILSGNTALLEMSGYKREDLIGEHASLLAPEDKEIQENVMEKTAELYEKGFAIYESQVKNIKNGKITDLECTSSLIKDDNGEDVAAIGIMRDITERKIAEEILKQSEEKYQNLIENANDAVLSINQEGIIVTLNKKTEEMYGYTREELLGKSVILLVPPHRRAEQKKGLENLKTITKVVGFRKTMETIAFGKDGKEFPVETSMFGSEIHGEYILTSFIRDISERKKMEQHLLQSEKLKSLGELAGGVAHDFNNILAAVLGRVQLLKRQFNPPMGEREKRKSMFDLKAGLEVIERASLDGADTVRRIQEFCRRSVDDKNFTQVDVNELIDNALEFTRVRWKNDAESKGIKIRIKKELSPLNPTLGSSSELREVFTNLINNAIDAMPKGGEIRVRSFMDDSSAVIKIEDTGGGIPKNLKDRVFDPFFTTKGVKSTGLGLSVSYGIINRHQGTITADSVEGEGTTFTLTFPVTKKTGKREVKEEKVIPIKRKHNKARILVVEDEEDIRQLLRDILTDAGHYVEIANGGTEGVEIFKKKEFDLVFTDLGMPVMSGWEVAKKVKSINKKVPVALITGWNVKLDGSEMNDSGINLVIHKPFKMEQVLNLVQEGMLLRDKLKAV